MRLLYTCYDPLLPFGLIDVVERLIDMITSTAVPVPTKVRELTNFAIYVLKVAGKRELRSLNFIVSGNPDEWLVKHTYNVVGVIAQLMCEMRFPFIEAQKVIRTVVLHDLGHIPLRNPLPLSDTPEGGDRYRLHVVLGYRLCRELDLSMDECDAILTHHENFDGSGFMSRRGKTIPFYARLMRIADDVEKLVTDQGVSTFNVMKHFMLYSSKLYDPDMVRWMIATFGPIPTGTTVRIRGEEGMVEGAKDGRLAVIHLGTRNVEYIPFEKLRNMIQPGEME